MSLGSLHRDKNIAVSRHVFRAAFISGQVAVKLLERLVVTGAGGGGAIENI